MAEFEILAIGLDEVDAPAKFGKSFRETGFAIIKDHNISSDEIDRMYGVWTDFFASDEGPNFAVKPGESAGYFGYKSENAKGSANKDLKEFFHAYQNKTLPNITEKEASKFVNPIDKAKAERDGQHKTKLWIKIKVEEAYIHCSKHIPKLKKQDKIIHWGTDDENLKGGDFFKTKGCDS